MRAALYLLPLIWGGAAMAQPAVDLDFSSLGSSMFISTAPKDGDIFFTPPASGLNFEIADASLQDLAGLDGTLSGIFVVGQVTSVAGFEEAPVTGTGTFSIADGKGKLLTGLLTWATVTQVGSVGGLNSFDALNLGDFSYSGTNPSLVALAADASAKVTLSFQFLPGKQLDTNEIGTAPQTSTFSGTLVSVPEPGATSAVIGLLVFALILVRRRSARVPAGV
jgi:hypothetical protein